MSNLDFPALGRIVGKFGRLRDLYSAEEYEESLAKFVAGAWHTIDSSEYRSCWAIDAVADHLEAVTMGHIKRLLINQPPRTSKTSLASICWNAWTWARGDAYKNFTSGPQVRFLAATYNDRLTLMNASKTRRLILSPWYQKHWSDRFKLRADQQSKSNFENTAGGARVSTSVRGSLLGLGADIAMCDDPHATDMEKKIETDADRRLVASWWQEFSSTRLNDPKRSALVVCMQRLHQSDLSGVILDSDEEFVHLMIPMEFDSTRRIYTIVLPQYDDPEPWTDPRTEDGELMWPERFGPAEVQNLKDRLGPYMYAGRAQQLPVPKGGGIIKSDWWMLWDKEEAARYGLEWSGERKEFPRFSLVVASLDTAFKEKEENDFNAMTVWGLFTDRNKNRRAMLAFAWNKRLPLHGKELTPAPGETKIGFVERQKREWGLVEWVADTCKRYGVQRLLIEDKTRGVDVANELKRLYARDNWGVELVPVDGDKQARVHAIVPLFTDDAIWAPNLKWSQEVIDQCSVFPKGEHDDLIDSVSQFLNWAREQGILVRADEADAALRDEMAYKGQQKSVANLYGV